MQFSGNVSSAHSDQDLEIANQQVIIGFRRHFPQRLTDGFASNMPKSHVSHAQSELWGCEKLLDMWVAKAAGKLAEIG